MCGTDQYGVPTNELAGEAMEAEPKSASLTWPGSVSRILPAFTSLNKITDREKVEDRQYRPTVVSHYHIMQWQGVSGK